MASAEIVAFHSVDHILDKVAGILQEKYLNSKINGHTIETTHDLVDLLFNTEFIAFDKHKFVDAADEEPPAIFIDNWGRSKIPSKKVAVVESHMEFNDGSETMFNEDKKVLQKAKDVGKKLIREAKSDNMPSPMDLQEPNEMNKTEDDLRQVKERERKRQDEERLIELHKKKAENQAKFKQGNADLKKKPFTYDFNGMPMLITSAKVEKFPPSAYAVQHAVHDPETENPKEKKKKTKDVPVVKNKQKKAPEAEQDFAKKFGLGVPTYDILEPQVGVTYIEGGKTKNSSKPRYNMTSVTSGSLISTLGANPRLTKTEYMQMTKGGNLSRTQVGEKDLTATAKTNEGNTKRGMDSSREQWNTKTMTSGVNKESHFNTTGAAKMIQNFREGEEGVNFNPEKLEALLKASEEIRLESLQPPKQEKRMDNKFGADDTLKRSPVDTFNLELLNSKDWGKNGYAGGVHSLPKLPSPQKVMQFEKSLGLKPKYPRYRTSNVPMEKNFSDLLTQTIHSQQMG